MASPSTLSLPLPRERNGLTLVEPASEPAILARRYRHLLIAGPEALLTHEHHRIFHAANYALRTVREWRHAIDWIERGDPDAVLLDIDTIDAACSSLNVSSARFVTLLQRASAARPVVIAGVSARDFVEIEDTLRAGVQVFARRDIPLLGLIQRIEAARARLVRRVAEPA